MAHFLRSRLTCFYCGRGSSQRKTPDLRKFECEHCNAENYLDENGEITDPPPKISSSSARYAFSVDRPGSPIFDTASSDIFCSTCLKNQHLLTQSLAQYYPPSNDPSYHEYDVAFPEYRRSLEQRYPQVCIDCEPMARRRLQSTFYGAKTDHMRRVMERLNPEMRHLNEPGQWRLWVPFLGGYLWALSWAGQIAWDAVSVLSTHAEVTVSQQTHDSLQEALRQMFFKQEVSQNLDELFLPYASYAIFAGILSVWWNPKMKEKLLKKGGRMVGLTEYYKLQIIFLSVRCLVWYCVIHHSFDVSQEQTMHIFMAIFSLVAIAQSYRTIILDYTPKVLFKDSPKSLLSEPPRPSFKDNGSPIRRHKNTARAAPFSIESLATKALPSLSSQFTSGLKDQSYPDEFEEDVSEGMDWTPTTPHVNLASPKPYLPPPNPFKPTAPPSQPRAGFKGHLPPNVHPPAHRLRNPPKLEFRAATPAQTQNFFSRTNKSHDEASDLFAPDSTFGDDTDVSPTKSVTSNLSPVKMAEPRFFPSRQQGKIASGDDETGLETMFERAFTVGSAPAEVRERQRQQEQQQSQRGSRGAGLGNVLVGMAAVAGVWAVMVGCVELAKRRGE